jgi:membrane-associated phospholipid phosphatase
MELNVSLFNIVHGLANQNGGVDALIRFCADPLGILLVLCVAWYIISHHTHIHGAWEMVGFLGLAFLAAGIAYGIKEFYPTLRPTEYFLSLAPLIAAPGAAFPSMHTAFYTALGSAMAVGHRRSTFAVLSLGIVVGVARVAAGVHWPMDIFFGFLLGGFVGWGGARLLYGWLCRVLNVCIV